MPGVGGKLELRGILGVIQAYEVVLGSGRGGDGANKLPGDEIVVGHPIAVAVEGDERGLIGGKAEVDIAVELGDGLGGEWRHRWER